MLTRLEVDGFKSFEQLALEAEATVLSIITNAEFPRLFALWVKAAFSGQRVTQDLNDEPASVLLGCIRAERAAAGGAAGKRASGRSRVRGVSGVSSSRERP